MRTTPPPAPEQPTHGSLRRFDLIHKIVRAEPHSERTKSLAPKLERILRPLQLDLVERRVLDYSPLNKFVSLCRTYLKPSHRKNWAVEVTRARDHYLAVQSQNTRSFQERSVRIPRVGWNFYYVKCGPGEFVWMADGCMSKNFVDFDFWLVQPADRNWIIGAFAAACEKFRRTGLNYDTLCFARKKMSGVRGPLEIAGELSRKVVRDQEYLVYDAKAGRLNSNSRTPVRSTRRKALIVYDLVCSGRGLENIARSLESHLIEPVGAVLLYNYGVRKGPFSFPTSYVISDSRVSQTTLARDTDLGISISTHARTVERSGTKYTRATCRGLMANEDSLESHL